VKNTKKLQSGAVFAIGNNLPKGRRLPGENAPLIEELNANYSSGNLLLRDRAFIQAASAWKN
jgi:hypothetical protein